MWDHFVTPVAIMRGGGCLSAEKHAQSGQLVNKISEIPVTGYVVNDFEDILYILNIMQDYDEKLQLEITNTINLAHKASEHIENQDQLRLFLGAVGGLFRQTCEKIITDMNGIGALDKFSDVFKDIKLPLSWIQYSFDYDIQQRLITSLKFVRPAGCKEAGLGLNLIKTDDKLAEALGLISKIHPKLQPQAIESLQIADVAKELIKSSFNLSKIITNIKDLGGIFSDEDLERYRKGLQECSTGCQELRSQLEGGPEWMQDTNDNLQEIKNKIINILIQVNAYALDTNDSDRTRSILKEVKAYFDKDIHLQDKEKFIGLVDECVQVIDTVKDNISNIPTIINKRRQEIIDQLNLAVISKQCIESLYGLSIILKAIKAFDRNMQVEIIKCICLKGKIFSDIDDLSYLQGVFELIGNFEQDQRLQLIEDLRFVDVIRENFNKPLWKAYIFKLIGKFEQDQRLQLIKDLDLVHGIRPEINKEWPNVELGDKYFLEYVINLMRCLKKDLWPQFIEYAKLADVNAKCIKNNKSWLLYIVEAIKGFDKDTQLDVIKCMEFKKIDKENIGKQCWLGLVMQTIKKFAVDIQPQVIEELRIADVIDIRSNKDYTKEIPIILEEVARFNKDIQLQVIEKLGFNDIVNKCIECNNEPMVGEIIKQLKHFDIDMQSQVIERLGLVNIGEKRINVGWCANDIAELVEDFGEKLSFALIEKLNFKDLLAAYQYSRASDLKKVINEIIKLNKKNQYREPIINPNCEPIINHNDVIDSYMTNGKNLTIILQMINNAGTQDLDEECIEYVKTSTRENIMNSDVIDKCINNNDDFNNILGGLLYYDPQIRQLVIGKLCDTAVVGRCFNNSEHLSNTIQKMAQNLRGSPYLLLRIMDDAIRGVVGQIICDKNKLVSLLALINQNFNEKNMFQDMRVSVIKSLQLKDVIGKCITNPEDLHDFLETLSNGFSEDAQSEVLGGQGIADVMKSVQPCMNCNDIIKLLHIGAIRDKIIEKLDILPFIVTKDLESYEQIYKIIYHLGSLSYETQGKILSALANAQEIQYDSKYSFISVVEVLQKCNIKLQPQAANILKFSDKMSETILGCNDIVNLVYMTKNIAPELQSHIIQFLKIVEAGKYLDDKRNLINLIGDIKYFANEDLQTQAVEALDIAGNLNKMNFDDIDLYRVMVNMEDIAQQIQQKLMEAIWTAGKVSDDMILNVLLSKFEDCNVTDMCVYFGRIANICKLMKDLNQDKPQFTQLATDLESISNVLQKASCIMRVNILKSIISIFAYTNINVDIQEQQETILEILNILPPNTSVCIDGGRNTAKEHIASIRNVDITNLDAFIRLLRGSPMNMVGRVMRYWTYENHEAAKSEHRTKKETQNLLSEWYDVKSIENVYDQYYELRALPWISTFDNEYVLNFWSPDSICGMLQDIQNRPDAKEYYRKIVGYLIDKKSRNYITPGFRNCMLEMMRDNGVTLSELLGMIDGEDIEQKANKLDLHSCISCSYFGGIAALANTYCRDAVNAIVNEQTDGIIDIDGIIMDNEDDPTSQIEKGLLTALEDKYKEEKGDQ